MADFMHALSLAWRELRGKRQAAAKPRGLMADRHAVPENAVGHLRKKEQAQYLAAIKKNRRG